MEQKQHDYKHKGSQKLQKEHGGSTPTPCHKNRLSVNTLGIRAEKEITDSVIEIQYREIKENIKVSLKGSRKAKNCCRRGKRAGEGVISLIHRLHYNLQCVALNEY